MRPASAAANRAGRVDLAGAACLVTGATGGIGRATAARLRAGGARLAVSGRDEVALAELAAALDAAAVPADLTEPGAPARVAAEAATALGPLDVVVSNAGAGWAGDFAGMPVGDIDRLVALNLTAPVQLARAVLPAMVERRGGHLVLVGSIAGLLGVAGEAVYSAAKAGLAIFADALRAELAGAGVAVSLITPGVVATPFFERRGVPYRRRFPRPVPASAVADQVAACLATGRAEAVVPAWLVVPARLRGAAPGLYRALAARFA
jgi:short-subunit dehydrogenase